MTAETPAATIQRAANRLRALATAVEPEVTSLRDVPWHTESWNGDRSPRTIVQGGRLPTNYAQPMRRIADAAEPALAEYIAAMGPLVGLALADWLDEAAEDARQIGPEPRAVAVARQILGETGSSPD